MQHLISVKNDATRPVLITTFHMLRLSLGMVACSLCCYFAVVLIDDRKERGENEKRIRINASCFLTCPVQSTDTLNRDLKGYKSI